MAAAADAERLWSDLDAHERELRREGYQLREIWHKINDMHRENAAEREEVEKKAKLNFRPGTDRVVLNVGGQQFETTAGVPSPSGSSITLEHAASTAHHVDSNIGRRWSALRDEK